MFLSAAAQWNNAQVAPLYTWFASKLLFLQLGPEQLLLNEYVYTAQTVSSSSDAGKLITDLLQSADFGVKNISAVDESRTERAIKTFGALKTFVREAGVPANTMPEKAWRVTFQHEGKDGELFPIEWGEASAGTQRFFTILGPWLSVALYNQVLCVDELDTSLHPSLAAELLRLFFQRASGKDGSQVIFTTHNPLLLDMTILRRDQIWFVDKSQEGESFLYPLTDYKPRADESLVRGYLSGRYGAVPFIPRGLTAGAEDEPANQTENVPHAG